MTANLHMPLITKASVAALRARQGTLGAKLPECATLDPESV